MIDVIFYTQIWKIWNILGDDARDVRAGYIMSVPLFGTAKYTFAWAN